MGRKRSRIDIITDMLLSIQARGGEIKPTHLMYKSNLSHIQMNGYLDELEQKELIAKVKNKQHGFIAITDKGLRFLQKIREMREFQETFGI